MYKIYFKQALEMLKQNKLISSITIIGTAFAIMMIMTLVVIQAIKDISIAPEDKRDRTMYIKSQQQISKDTIDTWSRSGSLVYDTYKNYISQIKTPELISLQLAQQDHTKQYVVTADIKKGNLSLFGNGVDDKFWQLMSLYFVEGKPFTTEEFNSGIKKAVISQSASEKLFGKENAVGKLLWVNFEEFTVSGVVKDVSKVFQFAHADVYIPYTTVGNYENHGYEALLLAKNSNDFSAISDEIRECERKASAGADYNLTLNGPYNHQMQQIDIWSNQGPDVNQHRRKKIFIFAILLLIPAINLSSFSMSNIKKRTEEIGIRKAFGAKKHIILMQVLYENLITSLIGGAIGLLLSFAIVYWLKGWLLNIDSSSSLPIQTFISLPIFVAVFFVCVVLNLVSAGLPAIRASRMSIVDSLNSNKK